MNIKSAIMLEDHPQAQIWLSDALKIAFGDDIRIEVCGCLKDAMDKSHIDYDIAIIDLHLPDGSGIALLHVIKQNNPACPCVIASIYDDDSHIFPALQAGANGYLLKDESKSVIASMLKSILLQETPISPAVAKRMLHYFYQQGHETEKVSLTDREKEILTYLAKGLSTKECAQMMGVRPYTASEYIQKVYKKLNVHSRAEATLEAVRLNLT